MDTNTIKMGARDFFLHLAVIALLYTGTVALLNVLFRIINVAFPQVDRGYGYYPTNISLPVATLIVVFPIFLYLANVLRKGYEQEPMRKEYAVRRWLIYITLFVAGAILAGDLVTIIYFFLDGRELTAAFLLKVLAVLVVIGAIFGYYMDDLKDRLTSGRRNFWRVVAIVLVIGGIVAGFGVLGSPRLQRLIRYDDQKVNDLQNIQSQVLNFYQQKGAVPESLQELRDPIAGFIIPTDPQTKSDYQYRKTGNLSFELCADFNKDSKKSGGFYHESMPMYGQYGSTGNNWEHGKGRQCFERTIDPDLYPVRPKQ